MMKRLTTTDAAALILIGLALFTQDAIAAEGDMWFDVHFGSVHSKNMWLDEEPLYSPSGIYMWDIPVERKFREFNPGIGITYETTDNLSISSGFVLNSFDNTSMYAVLDVHTSSRALVSYGVSVGPTSGYLNTPVETWYTVQPNIVLRTTKNTRARIGVQPFGEVKYLSFSGSIKF